MRHGKGVGATGKYSYDGDDVILDDGSEGVVKYQNGPGIDNKLRAQSGTSVSYFLADHLGSTNGLADNTGAVTASNSYDSFGNPSNGAFPSRYGFTGREFDKFTGLQYSRARFYDPNLGRFISEDPIGFASGDINLYGYVRNNPFRFSDPYGLFPFSYGDNPYDIIPERGWTGIAYAGNFAAGFGDHVTTIPFTDVKLTQEVRKAMGSDDVVDPCSSIYSAGDWGGFAWEIAAGGAGGLRAAGTRGVGREFSHWIPNRMGGPRSLWNGNYVSPARHYYHDPYRYPPGYKNLGPKWQPIRQQFDRIPNVYKGAAAGAVWGAASMSGKSNCECQK
jgi:RHS repeat-associated protein